ncbi:unnamed protein product [Durusdinium trenchii]|uniref:Uncharacterized protein n=2 Tax=Durusdinium trenchii TaxID=1381693 RepID=A0ABP0REJ6_9DINO
MVPVLHAVTRPASINFVMVLMVGILASFHAYSVFPIAENSGSFANVLNGFLKIFRLELLGDFELAELEGLDEQVKGKFKHGVFEGETGNFNHEKFHTWLCMEFMAMSIVFTVAMNVYIGLLSELYDKAVERKNGLYNHWLASTAYRFLCRSVCLCRFGRCVPEDKGPGQHQSGLMWFAYEEDHLLDVAT